MGALPDRLPGFQHVENDELRAKFERVWGVPIPPKTRLAPVRDVRGDGARRVARPLRARREPAQSEADQPRTGSCSAGSTSWSCRTSSSPRPPRWPTWCSRPPPAGASPRARSPTASAACSGCAAPCRRRPACGTTSTSSSSSPAGMGHDWGEPNAEEHLGRSAHASPGARRDELRAAGGARRPPMALLRREPSGRAVPAQPALGAAAGRSPGAVQPWSSTTRRSTSSTDEFPLRLTTGRRLDEYNTGVQTGGLRLAAAPGESLDLSPEDAGRLGVGDGEVVRVSSRRGTVVVPVRIDEGLRPGLTFMTLHFQDEVATNILTIDAVDPKSGTAEFKAAAIRVERLGVPVTASGPLKPLMAPADRRPASRSTGLGPPTNPVRASAAAIDACLDGRPLNGDRRDSPAARPSTPSRRLGWIRPGALDYICRRLTSPRPRRSAWSLLRPVLAPPHPPVVAHVCDDIACRIHGAEALCAELEAMLGPAGESRDGHATWQRSPCLGLCERAPAALVLTAGESPRDRDLAPPTLADILAADRRRARAAAGPRRLHSPGRPAGAALLAASAGSIPRASTTIAPRRLSSRCAGRSRWARRRWSGRSSPPSSWAAAARPSRRAASGRRWRRRRSPHYVVCNADESEPGTFKDRVLMEGDPFALDRGDDDRRLRDRLREGLPLRARRVSAGAGADRRAPSSAAAPRLARRRTSWRGVRFDVELRRGAGAYICGEETALFNSIEGAAASRATSPRSPSRPASSASRRSSTTSRRWSTSCRSSSTGRGVRGIGTERSTGPKLFCVSGHVARPGVYEVDLSASPCGSSSTWPAASRGSGRCGRAAGRCRGRVRGPGQAGHPPDLRGDPRRRRDARLGRGAGLRRHGRPPPHPAPHRPVLPRRVVRPVRPLPRRHRAAGGAPPATRGRPADRLGGRRRWPCSRRSAR